MIVDRHLVGGRFLEDRRRIVSTEEIVGLGLALSHAGCNGSLSVN